MSPQSVLPHRIRLPVCNKGTTQLALHTHYRADPEHEKQSSECQGQLGRHMHVQWHRTAISNTSTALLAGQFSIAG